MYFMYLANFICTSLENREDGRELIMTDKEKTKEGMLIGRRGQLIEPRKNFTIRLSDKEQEQAEYDAKANNIKISDYVRYLIVHGGRVDRRLAYDRWNLNSQIFSLCNNYDQMTRIANGCGYVFGSTMRMGKHLLEQIKDLLQEVVNR